MVQALPRVDLETADALRAAADSTLPADSPTTATAPEASLPTSFRPPTATAVAATATGKSSLLPPCPHAPMLQSLRRGRQPHGASMHVEASGGQTVGLVATVFASNHLAEATSAETSPSRGTAMHRDSGHADGEPGTASADGAQQDAHADTPVQSVDDLMRPTPASEKATVRFCTA